ncbi:MAG: cupin domain-containing protein [Chloroflexi bacterium]|nr:cupin domain-containing protein [Chloroflexota bacterium]
MTERLLEKKKEPEPREALGDISTRAINELLRQKAEGQVVIRGKEHSFEQSRQAWGKFLLHRKDWDKVGTPGWHIFITRTQKHSGKHIHQGGLALFVLEGEGYTVVDGERYDWEEGDLVVLPVKPGGVEHQHFNKFPDRPAEWIAFIYHVMGDVVSVGKHQVETHPNWKK